MKITVLIAAITLMLAATVLRWPQHLSEQALVPFREAIEAVIPCLVAPAGSTCLR